MKYAIWIIAACEVIRATLGIMQIHMMRQDTGARKNAYSEFVKSLKATDREFVRRILEEFEREEAAE